jgi:hypothetical protein
MPGVSPTFLIIGAQKSGTTSLFSYVTAHPAVVGATRKEVHYFDRKYFRMQPEEYRSFFRSPRLGVKDRLRRVRPQFGEATPYYLFYPHAPARAAAFNPDLKLIAVLRDPVERAYSSYQQQVRRGREPLSFEEAIDREGERIDADFEKTVADPKYWSWPLRGYSYVARGRYLEQIERWLEHFRRDRLLLLSSADLADDPAATVGKCFEFLGVPPRPAPGYPRLHSSSYAPMRAGTRERLAEYFAEPNRRLYDFLGRDLGWTKPVGRLEAAGR